MPLAFGIELIGFHIIFPITKDEKVLLVLCNQIIHHVVTSWNEWIARDAKKNSHWRSDRYNTQMDVREQVECHGNNNCAVAIQLTVLTLSARLMGTARPQGRKGWVRLKLLDFSMFNFNGNQNNDIQLTIRESCFFHADTTRNCLLRRPGKESMKALESDSASNQFTLQLGCAAICKWTRRNANKVPRVLTL